MTALVLRAWRWFFPLCTKHGKPLIVGWGPFMKVYWARKNQCWDCVGEEIEVYLKERGE